VERIIEIYYLKNEYNPFYFVVNFILAFVECNQFVLDHGRFIK